MVDWTIKELDAAAKRGAALGDGTLAQAVRYDADARTMAIELRNGASFSFPVDNIQNLRGASDEALAAVEIIGDGYGLHWEKLDVDFTVSGLAAGIFGTAKYMARKAGSSKSEAKSAAARSNGALGGRPRKAAG